MNTMVSYNNYSYAQLALQRSLELISEAVQGEKEDQVFYDYLIKNAPTEEQKEIITRIRNDELRHRELFKQIYRDFTGDDVVIKEEEFTPPATYQEDIKRAFFGELKAMEKYRVIRQGLPYRTYRDTVFSILTDELKHADLYNFINTELSARSSNLTTQQMTPDELIRYTEFLVKEGLEDVKRGVNMTHILQEFIAMGVLVGQGYSPEKAYETVEEWERTGESKLLQQSKNMRE